MEFEVRDGVVQEMDKSTTASASTPTGVRAKPDFLNYVQVDATKVLSEKIKGKFLLIKYAHDENREAQLLDFLMEQMPVYALCKEERDSVAADRVRTLWKKAVRRFAKGQYAGELGELILFHLLEIVEGAVQIVNKMHLKTSGNMHAHGADALHFGKDGALTVLFLGESKTGKKFSDVLTRALDDVKEYDAKDQQFDVDVACGHISGDIPKELKQEIIAYLTGKKEDLSDFVKVHAIFLGFEEEELKKLEEQHSGDELIKHVAEKYKADIEEYINKIKAGIDSRTELKNHRFLFFILPFKDLDAVRKKFSEEVKNG